MEIKVKLRHLRISPKKVRLVSGFINGMSVIEAEQQLKFLSKKSAKPILKLLLSGVAAAENNYKLKKDNLYIKSITVDPGVTLDRWIPRAFGRATPLRKRASHITLILAEKEVSKVDSGLTSKESKK